MACMTNAYLLQWIWVAIIVVVAVVFVARTLRRVRKNVLSDKECDDCLFINECGRKADAAMRSSVNCKRASRPRGCINDRV